MLQVADYDIPIASGKRVLYSLVFIGYIKTAMKNRFCIIAEPTNLWTVWDRLSDQPAELSGYSLIGLNRLKAEALADTLNKITYSSLRKRGYCLVTNYLLT